MDKGRSFMYKAALNLLDTSSVFESNSTWTGDTGWTTPNVKVFFDPPHTFSNGTTTIFWDETGKVFPISEGRRDVDGLMFRTLRCTSGERLVEVVWFEGEEFADGLARLAEGLRA